MNIFFTLILGLISGFFLHTITMKVSFKQRTIDNKIKVYCSLITHWVTMRNFIYSFSSVSPEAKNKFDKIYGSSQALIGQAILVCEDINLIDDINALNEKFYWTKWAELGHDAMGKEMDDIKTQGIQIANHMREDIKNSTRLDWSDITHILSGFKNLKPKDQHTAQPVAQADRKG
jgi:hypothetical protein